MRYGCCVDTDQIAAVAAAGFDFCELPARAVKPFEDDTAALPALRAISAMPIQPESFNVLIPGELKLCGPNVDLIALRTYLQRAFSRMVSLGGAVAVLGSGAARHIPAAWPYKQALDQLADALALAGEEASRAGILLALEHLNRDECNVFNTITECQEFIISRGLNGVYLLADLFHLEKEHEPLANVAAAGSLLVHVHTAGGGRGAPHIAGYNYAGLLAVLGDIGYNARISAECSWEDFAAQAPAALAYMRGGSYN
jgi:D-psicose/D-tagatose/L-ribulose 3-epimerase